MDEFDVCIVGSGAGAGPVALTLARSGHSVLVLEKGPWFTEQDFYKDELACCRRSVYTPKLHDEPHVIEDRNTAGDWEAQSTYESGRDFWNGNCVGGSSNFMSGFFYRLKPGDFKLLSSYGPITGANIADWPIDYDDLEPYYAMVEREVGVSGRVVPHAFAEPRSTAEFPYPPTQEHAVSGWIDEACRRLGLSPLPIPRAILSRPAGARRSCEYSGYCGSYGCSSGAKGSARAALLDRAVATGHCTIRPHAKVFKLESDARSVVSAVLYYDRGGRVQKVNARIYVVACQAIETARLLLHSRGPKHPNGLANNQGQVGRNLIFSAGGSGAGTFSYARLDEGAAEALAVVGPFVNRGLQDWYEIQEASFGGRAKGGTIDFLFRHPNLISRAVAAKWKGNDLLWGRPLQEKLKATFTHGRDLRFEAFCDWLPTDNCFVSLDSTVRDRWGDPVARVRIGHHEHDLKVGRYLAKKAELVLREMGAGDVHSSISASPPQNLVAGGCRFGTDPQKSVLDSDCRAHDVDNLYVTDGSFMPTGGSVPPTWTIYANAFRVADRIIARL